MSRVSNPSFSRRKFVLGTGLLLGAMGATGAYVWSASGAPVAELSPDAAYTEAASGEILLIDIRRPDEWQATGIGKGAQALDMRDRDFTDQLAKLVNGDKSRPVALICEAGVRSRKLSRRLTKAGFTQIINIPEGMGGSSAGPGWLARGLPVDQL